MVLRDPGSAAAVQLDRLSRRRLEPGADLALGRFGRDLFDSVEDDKRQVERVLAERTEGSLGKVFDRPGEARRLDEISDGRQSTRSDDRGGGSVTMGSQSATFPQHASTPANVDSLDRQVQDSKNRPIRAAERSIRERMIWGLRKVWRQKK